MWGDALGGAFSKLNDLQANAAKLAADAAKTASETASAAAKTASETASAAASAASADALMQRAQAAQESMVRVMAATPGELAADAGLDKKVGDLTEKVGLNKIGDAVGETLSTIQTKVGADPLGLASPAASASAAPAAAEGGWANFSFGGAAAPAAAAPAAAGFELAAIALIHASRLSSSGAMIR